MYADSVIEAFLKQNCFFNESVGFFGFRCFGRRFYGFFRLNSQVFLGQNCFLNETACFFWLQAF